MLKKDIELIFSPPYGSHHSGVWERCIRTTRKTLNALLKQQTLNDEALVTFMCEVESIINGKPIAKVSEDLRDLEPPTPITCCFLNLDQFCLQGPLEKKTYLVIEDGIKFRTWLISSGGDGLRACVHGGGGPQVGEVTCLGGVTRLSI